jgi:Chorismate mutase
LPNTTELREQIESIDEEIIDLIATRMEIADELARVKKESSQEYWDKKKEQEVINRYLELCEEVSLSDGEARMIAEVLLKISKERQKQLFNRDSAKL